MKVILLGLLLCLLQYTTAQTSFFLKPTQKALYKNCGNVLLINPNAVYARTHWDKPDSFYFKTQPFTMQRSSNFTPNKIMLFPKDDSLKVWFCVSKEDSIKTLDSAVFHTVAIPSPQSPLLLQNQVPVKIPYLLSTKFGDTFLFKIVPDANFQTNCPTESNYKILLLSMYLHKDGKTTLVYNDDLSQHSPVSKGIEFNLGGDIYQHKGAYITIIFSKLYRAAFTKEYYPIATEAYASYTFLIE